MLSEIKEGLRFVRHTRWFRANLFAAALTNAILYSPMAVLLPYFLRHNLHDSKLIVGYTFAAMGLSGAVGAFVASNLQLPRRRIRVMIGYWLLAALSALAVGFATNFWVVLIFPVAAGPLILLGNVIWESMMQTEIPRELLGRASSVDWFVSLGLAPLGIVLAGYLATEWGVRTYYVVMSLVGVVPSVWIFISRKINAIDEARVTGSAVAGPSPATSLRAESPSSQNPGI